MVGQVRFPDGRMAYLSDSGEWDSIDPFLATHLTLNYAPEEHGPATMPYGEVALQLAADKLGGKAEFARPKSKVPAGAI